MLEPLFDYRCLDQLSNTGENISQPPRFAAINLPAPCFPVDSRHLTSNVLKLIQLNFCGGGGTRPARPVNGYGLMFCAL